MKDFLGSMERGFAQGLGTLAAYGLALLALGYLVKPGTSTPATGTTTTPTATTSSTSGGCSGTYA